MARYAQLIIQALRKKNLNVHCINLGLTVAQQQRIPSSLHTWANHYCVWQQVRQQRQQWQNQIIHLLDGSYAYLLHALPAHNTVVTVHDIIPKLQISGALPGVKPSLPAHWLIRRSLSGIAKATQPICDSYATQADLVKHTHVLANACQVIYPPDAMDIRRQLPHNSQQTLFHVGNNAFYKNRVGVLRIFARLPKSLNLTLTLAGPPPTPELQQLAETLRINPRIKWLVNPDDATIAQHYQQAALLLFPSLYEGFGWPPLEAMAYNCPVVCSHHGSLPEVVGNAALTAAADDEVQLAEHCLTILQNQSMANQLRQQGQQRVQHFSVETFADQLINTYKSVLAN